MWIKNTRDPTYSTRRGYGSTAETSGMLSGSAWTNNPRYTADPNIHTHTYLHTHVAASHDHFGNWQSLAPEQKQLTRLLRPS